MIIKKLDLNYKKEYDLFLKNSLYSLFYHTYSYKDFLCDILDSKDNYLLFINNNDERKFNNENIENKNHEEIIACLPLIYKESNFGIVYNSLPFFGSIGDLILNENHKDKLNLIYELLKRELINILENNDVISLVIINNPFINFKSDKNSSMDNIVNSLFIENKFIEQNYLIFNDKRLLYLTMFNFEDNFESNIFKIVRDTARRNINKAMKLGIKVEIRNDMLDFLKHVHYENMDKMNGKRKPDVFFDKLEKYFNEGRDYNIFVSFFNADPVAALLVCYYKDVVEYFVPVIKEEYRSTQALSLAIYYAMEDSFYKGYRIWNWGGTHLEQISLINFKKKWSNKLLFYDYIILFNKNKKDLLFNSLSNIQESFNYFYFFPFKELNNLINLI